MTSYFKMHMIFKGRRVGKKNLKIKVEEISALNMKINYDAVINKGV